MTQGKVIPQSLKIHLDGGIFPIQVLRHEPIVLSLSVHFVPSFLRTGLRSSGEEELEGKNREAVTEDITLVIG